MKITVVFATPHTQDIVPLELPTGTTAAEAVARSGLVRAHALDSAVLGYAVHGKRCAAGSVLADGDRVELTRALTADPKEARRRRAQSKALPKPASEVKRRR